MVAQSIDRNRLQALQRFNSTFINQLLQWVVFGFMVLAIVLSIASVFYALKWLQRPFLGAFYEHTMVFNGTGPSSPAPEWALYKEVKLGDQLLAINGSAVRNDQDMQKVLGGFFPGETVTLTVK